MFKMAATHRRSNAKPNAGLIDVLIALFAAAGVVLFIFWLATQSLKLNVFADIPSFIESGFTSIWSSIAAGTAGIGLAAYRAVVDKGRPAPNWPLLIGGMILFLVVLIVALLGVFKYVDSVYPHPAPSSAPKGSALTKPVDASAEKKVRLERVDAARDFVIIQNGTQSTVDVGGYGVREGRHSCVIPKPTMLKPGETFKIQLVRKGVTAEEGAFICSEFMIKSGESIDLTHPDGTRADRKNAE